MIDTEQRQYERVPVLCVVIYPHLAPSPHPPMFHTVDLSLGGACIEAPESHISGALLAFHLVTPHQHVADMRSKVVHSEIVQPNLYHVGVRFINLSPQDRAILASEIERVGA